MKSDGVGGLERGGEGRRREGKEVGVSVKGQQGFSRMVPQKSLPSSMPHAYAKLFATYLTFRFT